MFETLFHAVRPSLRAINMPFVEERQTLSGPLRAARLFTRHVTR